MHMALSLALRFLQVSCLSSGFSTCAQRGNCGMEWKGHAGDHSHDATMGLWLRCCPRLFQAISKPRHMLIVGFLFGLGFDTATEVGLLGVVAVSHGLAAPICILLLPLLFMSGMCLLDTLNGLMMAWIYRTSVED